MGVHKKTNFFGGEGGAGGGESRKTNIYGGLPKN